MPQQYNGDIDQAVYYGEEDLNTYKKQRIKFGKKNFNYNSYVDIKKYLDTEDLKLYEDYKAVTGQNYDRDKAWDLLQKQNAKDRKLARKAKGGDEKARNYLFMKHMPAIQQMLDKRFNFDPLEFNDRLNDCFFIFLKVLDKYKPRKNDNFLRFMSLALPNLMINLLKKDSKHLDKKRGYKFEPVDRYLMDNDDESVKVPKQFMHFDKEYELEANTK